MEHITRATVLIDGTQRVIESPDPDFAEALESPDTKKVLAALGVMASIESSGPVEEDYDFIGEDTSNLVPEAMAAKTDHEVASPEDLSVLEDAMAAAGKPDIQLEIPTQPVAEVAPIRPDLSVGSVAVGVEAASTVELNQAA